MKSGASQKGTFAPCPHLASAKGPAADLVNVRYGWKADLMLGPLASHSTRCPLGSGGMECRRKNRTRSNRRVAVAAWSRSQCNRRTRCRRLSAWFR